LLNITSRRIGMTWAPKKRILRSRKIIGLESSTIPLEEFNTHTMWLDVANYQMVAVKRLLCELRLQRYKGFNVLNVGYNNELTQVWQLGF